MRAVADNSALDILHMPHTKIEDLVQYAPKLAQLPSRTLERLGIEAAYLPLLKQQESEIARFRDDESLVIPPTLDYDALHGLSAEMKERFAAVQPHTLVRDDNDGYR